MGWRDRLKAWWIDKVDNDSVRPWVPNYCRAWLAWAILATFWFPPVPTIGESMGPVAYQFWVWLAIPANSLPIIGLWMRHGGSATISTPLLLRDWMGLFFQATGHGVASVLLLQLEVGCLIAALTYDGPAEYAGMTIFVMFMLWPWTKGTALLSAQCFRKIQKGLQIEREAQR